MSFLVVGSNKILWKYVFQVNINRWLAIKCSSHYLLAELRWVNFYTMAIWVFEGIEMWEIMRHMTQAKKFILYNMS